MTTPQQTMRVELVGGPLCGQVKDWPAGARVATTSHLGGKVRYAYCGQGVDGKLRAMIVREDD